MNSRLLTRSSSPLFAERDLWNIELVVPRSVDFGAGVLDHLGPLLGICGNESAEVGRRACKHRVTEVGDSRLDAGISETRIDLLVELVDDLDRRRPGSTDPLPTDRLVARHEFAHSRNVWQDLHPRC